MGSYQNRLEHSYNNLLSSSENLVAAESRIRDADLAKEVVNLCFQRRPKLCWHNLTKILVESYN
nr:flagellin [Bacillus sp. ISL-37]